MDICDYILNSFFYKRYGYNCCWMSGCSTVVYPITWNRVNNCVDIQISSENVKGIVNSIKKLVNDIEKEFSVCGLDAYYIKNDGSCPNVVRIYLYKNLLIC